MQKCVFEDVLDLSNPRASLSHPEPLTLNSLAPSQPPDSYVQNASKDTTKIGCFFVKIDTKWPLVTKMALKSHTNS